MSVKEIKVVWLDLKATAHMPKGETRQLLTGVSGVARPGEILAVMGPSGSGKTTFLNVLAQVQPKAVVTTGTLIFGGQSYSTTVRNVMSYLYQDELIWPELTVREQLLVNARLRMPSGSSWAEKIAKVDALVSALGLEKCAGTLIGTLGAGISGGERKRLAVGCELLVNPVILLADEPTSGLDSYMAEGLILLLKKFAAGTLDDSGQLCTVVTTIHQPSSELFASFDSLLLLSEGGVAYMGVSGRATELFMAAGCPVPPFTNPADHYMRQLAWGYMDAHLMDHKDASKKNDIESSAPARKHLLADSPAAAIRAAFAASVFASDIKQEIDEMPGILTPKSPPAPKTKDAGNGGCLYGFGAYNASYFIQFLVVCEREAKIKARNKLTFVAMLLRSVVLGILFGGMYYQVDHDQRGVQSLTGAMFLILINTTFTFLLPSLQVFPGQIKVVRREHQSGMYSVLTYYGAKMLSEMPFDFVVCSIFVAFCYPMIGFAGEEGFFWSYYLASVLLMLVGQGMGSMASSIAPDGNIAIALGVIAVMFAVLPSGFAINLDAVPDYFQWLSDASFMTHCWKLLQISMWKNFGPLACSQGDQNRGLCVLPTADSAGFKPYEDGHKVLNSLSIDEDDKNESIMVLVIIILVFRSIALLGTYIKSTMKT